MLRFGRVPKPRSLLQTRQSSTKRLTSPHGLTDQRTTGTTHSSCLFPPPTPARSLPFPAYFFHFPGSSSSYFRVFPRRLFHLFLSIILPGSFHHLTCFDLTSTTQSLCTYIVVPPPATPLSIPPPRILSSVSFVYLYFTSNLAVRPSVVQ